MGILTKAQRRSEAVRKIDQLDLSSVKDDDVALEELKKFFQLGLLRQYRGEWTGMPACYLDTFWHKMLESPTEYENICQEVVGSSIDHVSYNGEGLWEWVQDYEVMFGSLNPIWFTDLDGIFNGPMYMEYVETGVVKASWNCSPLVKPSDKELENCLS